MKKYSPKKVIKILLENGWIEKRIRGSHHIFIADVLGINADDKYIDENGAFDISKCNLIAYANGGYYCLGKKVGKFGFSVKKKKN